MKKLVIIFDYDGVIVNSLDINEKSVISAFQKNGCYQINSRKLFLDLLDGNFFESAINAGIPRKKIPTILEDWELDLRPLYAELKLFDGIKKTLIKLAEKCKMYIVTSNFSGIVRAYLESQNIMIFEEVIGVDKEVSKAKKLGYIKSKFPNTEFLYVGDTKGDIIEGRLANIKTAAVTWGWHSEERLRGAKPDFVIHSPNELVALVDSLLRKDYI